MLYELRLANNKGGIQVSFDCWKLSERNACRFENAFAENDMTVSPDISSFSIYDPLYRSVSEKLSQIFPEAILHRFKGRKMRIQ